MISFHVSILRYLEQNSVNVSLIVILDQLAVSLNRVVWFTATVNFVIYWSGAQEEFRGGSSKMMEMEYYYTTSAGVLLFPSYYLCCSCEEIRDGRVV